MNTHAVTESTGPHPNLNSCYKCTNFQQSDTDSYPNPNPNPSSKLNLQGKTPSPSQWGQSVPTTMAIFHKKISQQVQLQLNQVHTH